MTEAEVTSAETKKEVSAEELKKTVEDYFKVSSAWSNQKKEQFVINCPSGQNLLADYLGQNDLIEADLLQDMDTFTRKLFPIIDPAGNIVEQLEAGKDSFFESLKDPQKRARFHRLINKLMEAGVSKPEIIDDGVRVVKSKKTGKTKVILGSEKVTPEEGQVLASKVDFADRMHIFTSYNQPLSQLNIFREQQVFELASMERIEDVGSPA